MSCCCIKWWSNTCINGSFGLRQFEDVFGQSHLLRQGLGREETWQRVVMLRRRRQRRFVKWICQQPDSYSVLLPWNVWWTGSNWIQFNSFRSNRVAFWASSSKVHTARSGDCLSTASGRGLLGSRSHLWQMLNCNYLKYACRCRQEFSV
jgi:hypothetical protein